MLFIGIVHKKLGASVIEQKQRNIRRKAVEYLPFICTFN